MNPSASIITPETAFAHRLLMLSACLLATVNSHAVMPMSDEELDQRYLSPANGVVLIVKPSEGELNASRDPWRAVEALNRTNQVVAYSGWQYLSPSSGELTKQATLFQQLTTSVIGEERISYRFAGNLQEIYSIAEDTNFSFYNNDVEIQGMTRNLELEVGYYRTRQQSF